MFADGTARPAAWDDRAMTDRITLTGLRLTGHHGVFPEERRDGQSFVVDLTVWLDTRAAAAGDDLQATLNYAELAEVAQRIVTGAPRDLIETVAAEIVDEIMRRWSAPAGAFPGLHAAEVTVHKPQAPIPGEFADVAVTARRSAPGGRGRSR